MSNASRILIAVGLLLVTAAGAYLALRDGRVPAPRAFVANYKDDTVSVVDLELEREIKVLKVGNSPYGIAVCPGPRPLVVVANSTGREVTFIDAETLEILGRVETGKGPEHLTCSRDGKRLFVTSPYDFTVTQIDPLERKVVGTPFKFDKKPGPVALSPDGKRLFLVVRDEQGKVLAIDPDSGAVTASAPVGRFPTDLALDGDGSHLVVASFDDSTVTAIDTATFAVLGTYPADTGTGLLAHPAKPLAYSMAGMEDTVTVVDYAAGKTVATIEVTGWPTYSAISPDGRFLYVVNEDSDNLVKVDTETNQAVLRIAVGDGPADAVVVNFPS